MAVSKTNCNRNEKQTKNGWVRELVVEDFSLECLLDCVTSLQHMRMPLVPGSLTLLWVPPGRDVGQRSTTEWFWESMHVRNQTKYVFEVYTCSNRKEVKQMCFFEIYTCSNMKQGCSWESIQLCTFQHTAPYGIHFQNIWSAPPPQA